MFFVEFEFAADWLIGWLIFMFWDQRIWKSDLSTHARDHI